MIIYMFYLIKYNKDILFFLEYFFVNRGKEEYILV